MNPTIMNVRDLLEHVHEAQVEPGCQASPPWFKDQANLWFRGHALEKWLLQPQVLRDGFAVRARNLNPHAPDPVFSFEASLFNQFRRRGHHLLPVSNVLTKTYFLAQHHGLPTRLLDWSINPLVSLFFAVTEHADHNGSVIVMRARHEIPGQEERDIMYEEDPAVGTIVKSLFDREFSPEQMAGLPLRIMPDVQSGRMLHQDSRFTLHQPGCQNLDDVVSQGFIRKLEVSSKAKCKIREELRFLGVHWGTLFPDLPNLVKQIRHEAHA